MSKLDELHNPVELIVEFKSKLLNALNIFKSEKHYSYVSPANCDTFFWSSFIIKF